eukprot:gene7374-biopygen272
MRAGPCWGAAVRGVVPAHRHLVRGLPHHDAGEAVPRASTCKRGAWILDNQRRRLPAWLPVRGHLGVLFAASDSSNPRGSARSERLYTASSRRRVPSGDAALRRERHLRADRRLREAHPVLRRGPRGRGGHRARLLLQQQSW